MFQEGEQKRIKHSKERGEQAKPYHRGKKRKKIGTKTKYSLFTICFFSCITPLPLLCRGINVVGAQWKSGKCKKNVGNAEKTQKCRKNVEKCGQWFIPTALCLRLIYASLRDFFQKEVQPCVSPGPHPAPHPEVLPWWVDCPLEAQSAKFWPP